jgi:hypothetical protein
MHEGVLVSSGIPGIAFPVNDMLLCAICVEWLHVDDLYVDPNGDKWDTCKPCGIQERDQEKGVTMPAPELYRKKPVWVSAMNWQGGNRSAGLVVEWILSEGGVASWTSPLDGNPESLRIETLEGTMRATPGDWIIRGVSGEFYPCKPDIFAATYEQPA